MIKEIVDQFMERKQLLKEKFTQSPPGSYLELVKTLIEVISDGMDYEYINWPDPERITEIDHGDYQGTLLYIIGAKGYQPDDYYSVFISYGSCSSCDTLQAIDCDYKDNDKAEDYLTLALHVVQKIKKIEE